MDLRGSRSQLNIGNVLNGFFIQNVCAILKTYATLKQKSLMLFQDIKEQDLNKKTFEPKTTSTVTTNQLINQMSLTVNGASEQQ